jgi:DNA-binding CsgD family transcriptional regulator
VLMHDSIPMERRISWLTPRERIVLGHLALGLTVEDIAVVDFLGVSTIRSQVSSILRKLGVTTQQGAVVALYQLTHDDPQAAVSRVLVA